MLFLKILNKKNKKKLDKIVVPIIPRLVNTTQEKPLPIKWTKTLLGTLKPFLWNTNPISKEEICNHGGFGSKT